MRRHARGFTLIEALVAVGILGAMLASFHAVLTSAPLARGSKNETAALTAARMKLESLRSSGYDALPSGGSFADAALASIPMATGTVAVSAYNADTKAVTVSVLWQEPNRAASSTVSLTTLITRMGGLP